MMQSALRAGVCLFMLSGACVLSAQTEGTAAKPSKPATALHDKYVMKEVSGFVYDAATHAPLAGVKVQALNNSFYTALTDDKGAYTIRIPDFVTSLYVTIPDDHSDYNASNYAIKGLKDQNVYLYSNALKNLYFDGTQLFNQPRWMSTLRRR